MNDILASLFSSIFYALPLYFSLNRENYSFFGMPYFMTMFLSKDFEALIERDSGGL